MTIDMTEERLEEALRLIEKSCFRSDSKFLIGYIRARDKAQNKSQYTLQNALIGLQNDLDEASTLLKSTIDFLPKPEFDKVCEFLVRKLKADER